MGGALAGLAAGVVAIVAWASGLLDCVEARTLDRRQRLTLRGGSAAEIVVLVYLDDQSIEFGMQKEQDWGGWPWPRSLWAPIIRFAKDGGAKAIIFDIIFSEPSRSIDEDAALTEAASEAGNVYFVQSFSAKKPIGEPDPAQKQKLEDLAVPVSGDTEAGAAQVMEAQSIRSLTIASLLLAAKGIGNAQHPPDPDGIYRRLHPIARHGDRFSPTVSLAVARDLLAPEKPLALTRGHELVVGPRTVPLEPDGTMLLRFRGRTEHYPSVPAAAVIAAQSQKEDGKPNQLDRDRPNLFRDKVVLVGYKASGLYDLRPNPVDGVAPGSLIHAAALEQVLAGDFIRSWTRRSRLPAVAALLLLPAAVGALVALVARVKWGVLLVLGVAAAWLGAAYAAFAASGLWIDVVAPEAAIALGFVGATAFLYVTEGKQRRLVKSAFEHYLAPALVNQLMADPTKLKLGGEKKELSIFFSDLAGFTSMSESLQPEELVKLLNEYLTRMTSIILKLGGTHDKYEGDAIMCFFGAPLEVENHAALCCFAAIDQQRALEDLNLEWSRVGLPKFKARMGINTGPVIVGNMGSESTMDYTVIGDSVNLASRLEGANKAFGTKIMIGERTREVAGHTIEVRELGGLRVKGKSKPVKVFELLGRKGEVPDAKLDFARQFEDALRLNEARDFVRAGKSFEEIANNFEDEASHMYLAECRKFQKAAPPPEWDGVITLTSK